MTTTGRVLVALAALAVPLLAITAVHAANNAAKSGDGLIVNRPETTLDRSYQCTTGGYSGRRVIELAVWPNGRGNPPYPPAAAQLSTGPPATPTTLYFFDSAHQNPTLDGSRCRRLTKTLAFSHKGLTSRGTWVAPEFSGFRLQCGARRWKKVDLRVRIQLRAGLPRNATVELQARLRKGSNRLAYVLWSPRKVTAFAGCGG